MQNDRSGEHIGTERSGSPPAAKAVDTGLAFTVPPAELVEVELRKILASNGFVHSDRLSRFLRFAVETTLGGRGEELKEYLLGVEVFDRGPDFDQRTDSIVRVEARRLRQKLEAYYKTDGSDDPVRIIFTKGGYAPVFQLRAEEHKTQSQAAKPAIRVSPFVWLGIPAILILALSGLMYWMVSTRAAKPDTDISSIVVLPFLNLSADPENEYFTDGLVEELTTALSKVRGLHVVARTSAYQFKDKQLDLKSIGQKLKVNFVLEGSVRRISQQLRIAVQLIRVSDDRHLWSEIYERDVHNAFRVQNEISSEVVKNLKLKVAPGIGMLALGPQTESEEAYNLYLKGRYFRRQMTAEGVQKSVGFFEEAIAKSPDYTAAHAALADSYAMLAFHGLLPSGEAIPKAKKAIDAALRVDDTNSRAHGALAWIRFFYDWDWTGAEKEFRRAIELDPGWSNVRQWFAFGLLSRGKFAEAIAQCQEAMELEPLSYITSGDLGVIHYYARNYQEAMREARQTLEMDSGNEAAHALMGLCFAALGRYEDAIAEYRKAMGPLKQVNTVVGRLGQACAMAGSRNEASALLDLLARDPSRKTIPHVEMAYIFLGLGDLDRTFEMLEKALQEHEAELVFLNVEPAFDPLRSDPRFIAMLKKVGF